MRATKGKADKAAKNGPPILADVLTLAEAAAYLRVPETDLLRLATIKEVPGRSIGGEWRFLKSALADWLGGAFPRKGLLGQIGALKDDPHREEMLKEIYARRGRPETSAPTFISIRRQNRLARNACPPSELP